MAQGAILWFDVERGFGFIRPDLGPRDVFVHMSALVDVGPQKLDSGDLVEFELIQTRDGRLTAQRVIPLPRARDRRARRPRV